MTSFNCCALDASGEMLNKENLVEYGKVQEWNNEEKKATWTTTMMMTDCDDDEDNDDDDGVGVNW